MTTGVPSPWVDVEDYASFIAAIDAIGATERTLLIASEKAVADNKAVPSNVTLKFLQGGSLNVASTKTVTINGHVEAELYQIFKGAGSVAFGSGAVKEVYPEWWGAKADGSDDAIAIMKAINGFSRVKLSPKTYHTSHIYPKSNMHLLGEGKWLTTLKPVRAGINIIWHKNTAGTLSNIVIKDIGFDGSEFYPSNRLTTYPPDTTGDWGIMLGEKIENATIQDCYFAELTGGSIYHTAEGSSNLIIKDNIFYRGAYRSKTIALYGTGTDKCINFRVEDNILTENGPTGYYNASKYDYVSSLDGIHLDQIFYSIVSRNLLNSCCGDSIRIEQSPYTVVSKNIILDSGLNAITLYYTSHHSVVTDNIILRWGRIPHFFTAREYNGGYYIAREFPMIEEADPPLRDGPALPVDPSSSSWFEENPYSLDNVDEDSILDYDTDDYYYPSGGGINEDTGIVPFRGYAAISITHETINSIISDNYIEGSLNTGIDGKFVYACDYGIASVHAINIPRNTGGDSQVSGNIISGCHKKSIYFPMYHDPINEKIAMDRAIFSNNEYEAADIFGKNRMVKIVTENHGANTPIGYAFTGIIYENTTVNAVTNLRIGSTNGGQQIVANINIGADEIGSLTLLQRAYQLTPAGTMYITADDWNSASITLYMRFEKIE